MISYFVKSASCLALLLFFYHFILEKEKMHSFNRFYLLIGVIISILIPFTTITINTIPETIAAVTILNKPQFSPETMATIEVEEVIDYTKYFVGFYLLISSLLLIRFGRNLFKIIQKIRLNEKINHVNATLVLVDDKILPHTFWKAIFINKNEYENGNIEEELFTHELTHVTQKHTIDVLLIELLQIIFWINPLFIFLKKAIQLNHEFLADDTVINQHKNTFQYQYLLLNKAAWNNEYYLASNLNYSLTKKRLKMMTTESSHSIVLLKKLAVIPVLTGFIFLFANRVEAQTNTNISIITNELKEYNTLSKIFNEAPIETRIIKLKDLQKLELLYSKLTDKEKEKAEHFPESYFPDESTKKLKKIIEEIGEKYNRNSYDELNKLYESKRNQEPHFIKSSKKRQEDLSNQYYELESLYFRLSKADKKKAKRPILPHDPYLKLKKNNKVFYKLRNNLTEEDKLLIPPPPPAPNASKEEILRAKKAYSDWKIRTGNDNAPLPPPPPPKKN